MSAASAAPGAAMATGTRSDATRRRRRAPIAASAAACSRPRLMAASRSRAIPSIPPTSAGCARKAPRSPRRCRSTTDCCIRDRWRARDAGMPPSISSPSAFRETIAEHGPDRVAFYVSGQILTEDYYVANKLMKGFIGSANIDTNSRLCMASSVAGHNRAFGSRHGARLLRGPGTGGPRRPRRLQSRLVPPGALPAPGRGARDSAAPRSSSSIRAVPRPARSPTCIWRWRRAPTSRCSTACSTISSAPNAIDKALCRATYTRASERPSPRHAR